MLHCLGVEYVVRREAEKQSGSLFCFSSNSCCVEIFKQDKMVCRTLLANYQDCRIIKPYQLILKSVFVFLHSNDPTLFILIAKSLFLLCYFFLLWEVNTCQHVKFKDGSFPTDEEEHRTIGAVPVSLIHKEFLQQQKEED